MLPAKVRTPVSLRMSEKEGERDRHEPPITTGSVNRSVRRGFASLRIESATIMQMNPARRSMPLWSMVVLATVPLLTMVLFVTRPGHEMLHAIIARPANGSVLPGLTVEDALPPAHGLIVTSLGSRSAAASLGVAVGDEIDVINGLRIHSVAEAMRILRSGPESDIRVELVHNHQRRHILLPLHGGLGDGTQAAGGRG